MSDDLTLTFDDKDLMRQLDELEETVRNEGVSKGLSAAANYLVGQIKINIVSRKLVDTGNLWSSVTVEEIHLGSEPYVEFGPHTVYAAIHEFGGIILPIKGPFLWFIGEDGHLIRTKSVHMPARPYLRPALDEHGDEAIELLRSTIGGIIEVNWKNQ